MEGNFNRSHYDRGAHTGLRSDPNTGVCRDTSARTAAGLLHDIFYLPAAEDSPSDLASRKRHIDCLLEGLPA